MSDVPPHHILGTVFRFFPPDNDATPGVWFGRDEARRVYLRVAGDASGPFPAYAAALEALVGALADVTSAIDRFVAALPPSGSIPFGSRPTESFPARICGFGAGHTYVDAIAVTESSGPTTARLSVVTGEPDGYVVYRVTLERGAPIHIDAVFT